MTPVVIRPATVADVAAIQSVGLVTWPPTYLPFTSPDYVLRGLAAWWSADAVLATITRDTTFVAELDGQVIGTATLGVLGDDRVIWKLYVVPAHHGTGAGHALMQAMLDTLPPDAPVLVEFIDGNRGAQRFYERHGFVFDHVEPNAQGPDQVWLRRPPSRSKRRA